MRSFVPPRAAIGRALALALWATAALWPEPARAEPLALPKEIHVSVERCVGLVFDVEAYAQALSVELVALGIREPGSAGATDPGDARSVELRVTAPGCRDELSVTLRLERPGESRQSVETLRPSDFEGLGRERALALATVERLRVSWSRLIDPPSALGPPLTAAPPAVAPTSPAPPVATAPQEKVAAAPDPKPKAPPAKPAREAEKVKTPAKKKEGPAEQGEAKDAAIPTRQVRASGGYVGGGLGYLGELGWQARAGLFFDRGGLLRIDPQLEAQSGRDYQASEASRAYALLVGATLQVQLYRNPDFELSVGPGLRFGLAWVDYDAPDASADILVPAADGTLIPLSTSPDHAGALPAETDPATGAAPSSPLAPLALSTLTLSVRATIAEPVAVVLWVEGGYALLGARFYAQQSRLVELTGVSFSLGLAIAYMF